MLARVFLCQDAGTGFMNPFVSTSVIEVPVRVNELLDGIRIDARDRFRDIRPGGYDLRIDEQLPVGAGKNGDISTRTEKNTYIPPKVLDSDLGCRGYLESGRDEHILRLIGQGSWNKASGGSG
jgi:hypothetical protein